MSLLDYEVNSLTGNEPVKKNTGILGQLAAKISDFLNRPNTPTSIRGVSKSTTETGTSDANVTSLPQSLYKLSYDRKSVWKDLDEMDINDDIISTALDIIADCTTGYEPTDTDGFDWALAKKAPEALKLLADLKDRLELGSEIWQITRSGVKFGEEFREPVIDAEGIVQRFKHLPSYQIWPNFDSKGNKVPGWEQRVDGGRPGSGIQFEEWQVIPFIFGAKDGYFGTGLLQSSRRTWRRLQKMEDSMVLARLLRGYDKTKHKVPVRPEWNSSQQKEAVDKYKAAMTRRKVLSPDGTLYSVENPISVETDYFLPDDGTGKGDIDILAGQNHQLQNIEDMEYHMKRLLSRLKVPRHYLNLGSGMKGALTSGGTSLEDIQFARSLRQNQAVDRRGLLELGTLALFLSGYNADDLGLSIVMAKINTEDFLHTSLTKLNLAKTAQMLSTIIGGLPPEILADEYMDLKDKDRDVLVAFAKKMEQDRQNMLAAQMNGIGQPGQNNLLAPGQNPAGIGKGNRNPRSSNTSVSSGNSRNGTGVGQKGNLPGNKASSVRNTTPNAKTSSIRQDEYDPDFSGLTLADVVEAVTNWRILAQNNVEFNSNEEFEMDRQEIYEQTAESLIDSTEEMGVGV